MPVVPIEVLPYIRGIQLVLSSYEGYTKGKRREADKLIRDEIKRAGTRARNHISNIQDIAFKTDKLTVAKIAKLATTEIELEELDTRQLLNSVDTMDASVSVCSLLRICGQIDKALEGY